MPEPVFTAIATAVGIVGTVLTVLSFQCRKTAKLMFLQFLSSLAFAVQLLMLGALAGAAVNVISMLLRVAVIVREKRGVLPGERTGASMFLSPWLWGFILLLAGSAVLTYNGPLSLLPSASLIVYALAIWNSDAILLRRANFFVCSPMWLVYNLATHAYPGAVTNCINMLSVAVSFLRFFRKRKSGAHA